MTHSLYATKSGPCRANLRLTFEQVQSWQLRHEGPAVEEKTH